MFFEIILNYQFISLSYSDVFNSDTIVDVFSQSRWKLLLEKNSTKVILLTK